ncbi:MAG: hypothetical protein ACQESC_01530 [Nanobdellota archaeon]
MISSVPRKGQEDRAYQTLNVYTSGLSHMHSGPMKPPGGSGPLPMNGPAPMDQPGQFTNRYGPLVERVDLSGHGGSGPHLNYDIYGASSNFSQNALGPSHQIDLFKK